MRPIQYLAVTVDTSDSFQGEATLSLEVKGIVPGSPEETPFISFDGYVSFDNRDDYIKFWDTNCQPLLDLLPKPEVGALFQQDPPEDLQAPRRLLLTKTWKPQIKEYQRLLQYLSSSPNPGLPLFHKGEVVGRVSDIALPPSSYVVVSLAQGHHFPYDEYEVILSSDKQSFDLIERVDPKFVRPLLRQDF